LFVVNDRKPLDNGTELKQKQKYVIDSYLAHGGSCLVYRAHYTDAVNAKHNVILKEFYPFSAKVTRKDNGELAWDKDYKNAVDKAKITNKRLNDFVNNPDLASNAPKDIDNFEENNTVYNVVSAVMSKNADVYSKYEGDKTIKDILKTISALTGVIQKIHDELFLHLDIKPGNFMVDMLPEGDRQKRIILFDVDSFVKVNEQGKIVEPQTVTFSDGYCAPELSRGKFKELGFGTDIFSLGVILFQKIFNRLPSNTDFWPNARYDFSKSEVFVDEKNNPINPAVQRIVQVILKKTLALIPSFRYENAEKLKKELETAIELCKNPYLESNICPAETNFEGRETELAELSQALIDNSIIIVEGEGGLGKTALVHKWYERNRSKFDTALYLDFKNGIDHHNDFHLIDLLKNSNIIIKNCDEKDADKIAAIELDAIQHPGVLLFVDNFDITDGSQSLAEVFKDLQKISNTGIKIIITSRNKLIDYYGDGIKGQIKEYELKPFDKKTAKNWFDKKADKSTDTKDFEELYNVVGGNTKALSLLAGLHKQGKPLSELIGGFKSSFNSTVRIDGERVSIDDVFDSLYEISHLNDIEKRALQYVYLFRRTNFDKKILSKIQSVDSDIKDDLLKDMCIFGWLENVGDSYFLHETVKRIVGNKLKPSLDDNKFAFLKKYEFYMYFTYSALSLVSHFEQKDHLKSIVIPAQIFNEHFERKRKISPFFRFKALNIAQHDGYLGPDVSVEENEYCFSKNNCIIYNSSDKGKTLVFASTSHSTIPDDENITRFNECCCMYYKANELQLPETVRTIGFNAFKGACVNKIIIPHYLLIFGCAFEEMEDATIIINATRNTLGRISPAAFINSNVRVCFTQCNYIVKNSTDGVYTFYIDRDTKEMLYIQVNRECNDSILSIPQEAEIIPIGVVPHDCLKISLHSNVTSFEFKYLSAFIQFEVDDNNSTYKVIGTCLVKIENGVGNIVSCWDTDLPTDEWITTISCPVTKKEAVIAEKNDAFYLPNNIQIINDRARMCCRTAAPFHLNFFLTFYLPASIKYIGNYAFWNCKNLHYNGTVEQFTAIDKSYKWADGLEDNQPIHCIDGDYIVTDKDKYSK